MPTRLRRIRGRKQRKPIVLPEGFRRWWTRKLKRKIPGLKSPYKFAMWTLSHHMKKDTIRQLVREFKRRK